MKTAIVTGITGQDGAYLAQLLLQKGYRVIGATRRSAGVKLSRLATLGIDQDVEIADLEMVETNAVNRLIRAEQADEFYNLAAQSFVGYSWDHPEQTTDVNANGVLRVLDALRTYSPHTRFYQASTSEMFGKIREPRQNEETPFYPRSPYAVAKAYSHYMTINYREAFGMHASSGILFNHESPLRGPEFVTRKITRGLARIAHGSQKPVELGNLNAKRDWGFAGDYVEGMWRMLQQDEADDYVLATGVAHSIRDFAQKAAAAIDIEIEWEGEGLQEVGRNRKTGTPVIVVNKRFFRPTEVEFLLGDASKARRVLGWEPTMSLDELAATMAVSDLELLAGNPFG